MDATWQYPKSEERDMILAPCDCRAPAPSKSRPSPLSRHYQCLGCNGWVAVRRITEENITMRG